MYDQNHPAGLAVERLTYTPITARIAKRMPEVILLEDEIVQLPLIGEITQLKLHSNLGIYLDWFTGGKYSIPSSLPGWLCSAAAKFLSISGVEFCSPTLCVHRYKLNQN